MPSVSNTLTLQTDPSVVRLKVVFEKQTDRWSHRICLFSEESETTILKSIEGNEQQPWPPSPPLQDASHQQLKNGDAVLAVGMAGKNHWSASFSCGPGKTILADLACLIKDQRSTEKHRAGSQYEMGTNVEIVGTIGDAPDVSVDTDSDGASNSGIQMEAGNVRLALYPAPATHLEFHHECLKFWPIELSTEPGRPTRWAYRIHLLDS